LLTYYHTPAAGFHLEKCFLFLIYTAVISLLKNLVFGQSAVESARGRARFLCKSAHDKEGVLQLDYIKF